MSGDDIATPVPIDTIAKLTSVWASLTEVGGVLTEDDWKRPTDLPGWTVQDVLSHLIGTERMLQGLDAAPARDGGGEAHVRNPIGDFNENEVAARRDLPGAAVLAEWNGLVKLRTDTLAAGDAAYFATPMATPTGPGTLADFLHVRVLDNWIHEQDIRRAVGHPGGLDTDAAAHTIDRLIRTIPIVVGKRAGCPDGQAVRIRITGGVEREVTCEVQEGRARFVDEPTAVPVATVTFSTEAFAVLACGRAADIASDPVGTGAVSIDGDESLGRRVVDNFNMMI